VSHILPAIVAGILGILAGCSAPGSTPPASTHGSSGGPPDTSDGGPISIPFVVSDQFVPSGFMGDSPTDFNGIKMSADSTACPTRAPDAKGACYAITWTPAFVPDASSAWVGVYWQYPSNNWGAQPGKPVSPGATKVSFYAIGAKGGEQIQFLAGGVNVAGSNPALTYADTFSASTQVTLTTSWQQYEVPLTGDTYSSVIGAFAWSITTTSTDPIAFYVDDIEWE
jgi:hypothetical protein